MSFLSRFFPACLVETVIQPGSMPPAPPSPSMSYKPHSHPLSSARRYSLARDGDRQLAPNFRLSEFQCKDGSDTIYVHPALPVLLQTIRDYYGRPVTINSGYRTRTYNKAQGGATASRHLYGLAADIVVSGISPKEVASFARQVVNAGGVGLYPTFTHLDVERVRSWGASYTNPTHVPALLSPRARKTASEHYARLVSNRFYA